MKRWIIAITVLGLVLTAGALPGLAQGNQGRLRAVHAVPGGPSLDVMVNGNTVFPNVAYKGITDYAAVNAGSTQVQFVPAGGGQSALIDTTIDVQANTDYTIVAVGQPDSIEPLVLVDDNTPPAPGQARVRFVHASPDAPAVNVAVQGGQTLFSNVAFKGVGNYISVPAGTVTLEVRDASSNAVLLTMPNVLLAQCTVYTIYAVGLTSGQPPLEAITSTDATTSCATPAAGATATPSAAKTMPVTAKAGTPGTKTATRTATKMTATPTATKTTTKAMTATHTATKAPTKATVATKAPTKATVATKVLTKAPTTTGGKTIAPKEATAAPTQGGAPSGGQPMPTSPPG